MKTIIICVIAVAITLSLCFIVSLIRSKTLGKKMRWTNLILPLTALLLFVGLFVGGSISRSRLRKELTVMKEAKENRIGFESRLKVLESRNEDLNWIIGRDEATESLLEEIKHTGF